MGRLIYTAICSLDGYIADEQGNFDWSMPDEAVHAFVNDLERETGTHLYGRRLYDVMVAWEDWDVSDEPEVIRDYAAIWRDSDKVVFSRTLEQVRSARTTLEREFDPQLVRQLKDQSERDLGIGGAELGGQALAAGLVDEIRLFLSPVSVGGGTRARPDGVRLDLELLDEHCFDNGVAYLRYGVHSSRVIA